MSVAHVLWIINIPLAVSMLFLGRDTVFLRRRRARDARRHFLDEALVHLNALPEIGPTREAWEAVLSQSVVAAGMTDARISAICALDCADDQSVDRLRDIVKSNVNFMNKFAELVDERLVRPKDIVRHYPDRHEALLEHLALAAPFIWHESILRGRGRWGFRVLRLKTIFEQLRVVSRWRELRDYHVLKIGDIHFLALDSVTAAERALGTVRLWIRSPTINVRSKLAQAKERIEMTSELAKAGVETRRGTDDSGPAVDW